MRNIACLGMDVYALNCVSVDNELLLKYILERIETKGGGYGYEKADIN